MTIDISPLENAIDRLSEGLDRYSQNTADDQIRDGLIQRFEFTYELSHKMLRRYLEEGAATPEVIEQMPFPELIRTASEQGLIQNTWQEWRYFRDIRNITSHTYNLDKALEVVDGIPQFLKEAQFLRDELLKRIGSQ